MEDLSPEQVSYFFLQNDYPEEIEPQLDQHIREQLHERFRRCFSRRERSQILGGFLGNRHYTEDNINEIADERGQFSGPTGIKTGAERLLDEYNDRVANSLRLPLEDKQFVEMELGWIANELLEDAETQQGSVSLDGRVRLGYDDGRYATISGQPIRLDDMTDLASAVDDEIRFEHFKVGEGATSSYHHTPPEEYDGFVNFQQDLPYGHLKAHSNGSSLKATDYSEELPEVVEAIQ